MGVGDENLEKRLEQLAQRLERIERHLDLRPPKVEPESIARSAEMEETSKTQTAPSAAARSVTPAPPTSAPPTVPPATPRTPAQPTTQADSSPPVTKAQSAPAQPLPSTPPPSARPPTSTVVLKRAPEKPREDRSLELAIGGKWAAWVGAIIVVLGAAFAAREYGAGVWFALSHTAQALIIAAFGGTLLLIGEIALRKIGPLASVGLFGAGLGVLYLVAFSTFAWYEPPILGSNGAFILMALVAIGGFALTLRTKFLTIGVLSLLGGYLTPILLREGGGDPLGVFGYLTMLPAIALGLAAAMPGTFRPLRSVALAGQTLIGLFIIVAYAQTYWLMSLVFVSMWWMLFVGESTYAALNNRSANNNAITTLLATAAYVTCATWVLAHFPAAGSAWLGAFTLAVALLSAAIAAQITTGLDVLKAMSPRAVDRLGIALFAQTGVLLVVAAALQFDGFGATLSWLAIALAAIEIGRRVDSKGATIFGLIVGALACAKVATIDQFITALETVVWSWNALHITGWSLVGLFAIVAVHIAARRVAEHRGDVWYAMPILLAITAMIGWVMWCMSMMDGLMLTGGWLLGSAALVAASPLGVRQRYLEIALVLLLMIAGKWLVIDAFGERFTPGWDATSATPLLNAQMGMALAIGVVAAGAFALLRRRERLDEDALHSDQIAQVAEPGVLSLSRLWSILIVAGSIFLLIAMSFEIDRYVMQLATTAEAMLWRPGHLRQVMLTMLWSIGALGIGLIGMFLIRSATRDHFPLRILLGCAWFMLIGTFTKWIFIDTLFWHLTAAQGAIIGMPLFGNAQMLAGLVLAATAVGLLFITMRVRFSAGADSAVGEWSMLSHIVPPAAAIIVLWGLSFEVDRLLSVIALRAEFASLWPHAQWVAIWLTGLWAAGGLVMMLFGRWRAMSAMMLAGWFVIVIAAIVWLVVDTAFWRLTEGVVRATPVLNLQFMVGLAGAALLASGLIVLRSMRGARTSAQGLADANQSEAALARFLSFHTPLALTLITLIGFWLGSFEIDRAFIDTPMARQVGWSVFWACYGAMLVLIGFVRLAPAARYAGLALLCATVAKVMVIDLAQVDQIWRVVSFLVLGLLLLATSVAYMKFAPRLLRTIQNQPTP
jgi:uncharacterized membrane protein